MSQINIEFSAQEIISTLLQMQNDDGSWGNPERFYTDKYKGTVWNILLLAELHADGNDPRVKKACEFILSHSFEPGLGGFSTLYSKKTKSGLSSNVIPCLTGNMVFSLIRLGYLDDPRLQKSIEWIVSYQRMDDGIYEQPLEPGSLHLKACFGSHTCFMGVVKALKALSEIPENRRTDQIKTKIQLLAEFILKHHIYKKSHNLEEVSKPGWLRLGFPLMYQTDILEILDILTSINMKDDRMKEAIDIIQSKSINDTWILENSYNGKMLAEIDEIGKPSQWITEKAKRVLNAYGMGSKS